MYNKLFAILIDGSLTKSRVGPLLGRQDSLYHSPSNTSEDHDQERTRSVKRWIS